MTLTVVEDITKLKNFQIDLGMTLNIALDTESTGLDYRLDDWLLLQVKLNGNIYVIDVRKLGKKYTEYIVDLIKSSNKLVIMHNAKYDLKVLYRNTGILLTNVYDLRIGEVLMSAGITKDMYPSLQILVKQYFDVYLDKTVREQFIGNHVITEQQILYAADDVEYLEGIYHQQREVLLGQKQGSVMELEMRLVPVITMMEYDGVKIDTEHWKSLVAKAEANSKAAKEKLLDMIIQKIPFSKFQNALELADFLLIKESAKTKRDRAILYELNAEDAKSWVRDNINLDSPNQLKNTLVSLFELNVENTAEKTLEPYIHQSELVKTLMEYRGYRKQVTTYGVGFLSNINLVTGRVHSEFDQVGAATGRFSSSKPNLQNIPADRDDTAEEDSYRTAFIAEPGNKMITSDYSQMELRMMGAISKEPKFIQAYKDGQDLHKITASILYEKPLEEITKGERRTGKTMNFAVIYGTSKYGLFYNFGIPLEDGGEYLKRYFGGYDVLGEFIKKAGDLIWNKKFSKTPLGRKRFFEDKRVYDNLDDLERYRARVIREGVNHIIQGGSADVVKMAMLNIFYNNPFGDKLKLLLQIHDEIVCEVEEGIVEDAKEFIRKSMLDAEQPFLGEIPAEVDISVGDFWSK